MPWARAILIEGAPLTRVAPGLHVLCTGTRIAPRLVITAKHGAAYKPEHASDAVEVFLDVNPIYFAIGGDALSPKRKVRAEFLAAVERVDGARDESAMPWFHDIYDRKLLDDYEVHTTAVDAQACHGDCRDTAFNDTTYRFLNVQDHAALLRYRPRTPGAPVACHLPDSRGRIGDVLSGPPILAIAP